MFIEIYKKKGLDLRNIKQESPLDEWFFQMIQKKQNELTIKDISHMLRQEIYLDIAMSVAWNMLLDNPFCGEMYDGELLVLMTRVLSNKPEQKDKDKYIAFKQKLQQNSLSYEWESDYEKEEYEKLLVGFRMLFE